LQNVAACQGTSILFAETDCGKPQDTTEHEERLIQWRTILPRLAGKWPFYLTGLASQPSRSFFDILVDLYGVKANAKGRCARGFSRGW
jgi:hypothetical protein